MAADRMRRVNEAVREVLSARIAEGLSDPRIGFVTVTSVETSPDLRHARVYVSVLGDDSERADTLAGLASAHGLLQHAIARELRMKRTPTLAFVFDASIDRGMRITELLEGDR
jgi:ribosome-binding factor A